MIKLVATDIDGTLLQSGEREVPEAVFVQIDRLLKKGILFAAASGRQYSNLKNLFAPKAEEMTFLCEKMCIRDSVKGTRTEVHGTLHASG